jgi:hypothetical protein
MRPKKDRSKGTGNIPATFSPSASIPDISTSDTAATLSWPITGRTTGICMPGPSRKNRVFWFLTLGNYRILSFLSEIPGVLLPD